MTIIHSCGLSFLTGILLKTSSHLLERLGLFDQAGGRLAHFLYRHLRLTGNLVSLLHDLGTCSAVPVCSPMAWLTWLTLFCISSND